MDQLEVSRFGELEAAIEAGKAQFIAVGRALEEIRDRRLYRREYPSFEAYCSERWGFSKSYGYRLLSAAKVADNVSPIGTIANESQARAISRLPPDQQGAALQLGIDEGDQTAGNLEEISKEVFGSLSPNRQAELIEEEEAKAIAEAHSGPEPNPNRDRVRRIESLVGKLKKLHAALIDVADRGDDLLDQYLALIGSSGET